MTRTIIGMQREGKTELTKWFIRRRARPVIIVNPLAEKYPGRSFAVFNHTRPDIAMLEHIMERGLYISEPLNLISPDPAHFSTICEVVKRHGNITLIVDEIDMFDSARHIERSFYDLVMYGDGHYQCDIITTSRRPANISRDLRSQTQEWYIFRITDGNDLDEFRRLNKELPDAIASLEPYHYVVYDRRDIVIKPPIPI